MGETNLCKLTNCTGLFSTFLDSGLCCCMHSHFRSILHFGLHFLLHTPEMMSSLVLTHSSLHAPSPDLSSAYSLKGLWVGTGICKHVTLWYVLRVLTLSACSCLTLTGSLFWIFCFSYSLSVSFAQIPGINFDCWKTSCYRACYSSLQWIQRFSRELVLMR